MKSLFKRKSITIDTKLLTNITDKCVLVTGGGEDIGSELCNHIAQLSPSQLIVFDSNEDKLAKVQDNLTKSFEGLNAVYLIGNTSDIDRINELFKTYKPEVIFHVDTYKNEGLLESSPGEAVKNNVLGTYNVAHAAKQNKSTSFTFISNDFDEASTSVYCSTMKIAEMMVYGANHYEDSTTCSIAFIDENNCLKLKDCSYQFGIDDFTFKLQSLIIAARTNDDNKTKDYLRIALKK